MPAGCFAYRRFLPGEPEMTVALNFTAASLEIAGLPAGRVVLATGLDRAGEVVAGRPRASGRTRGC